MDNKLRPVRQRGSTDSRKPPIFVFGCVRSGTTLLRSMLNAHPEISCPRETAFFILRDRFLRRESRDPRKFWSFYKEHRRFVYQGFDPTQVEGYLSEYPDISFKAIFDSVMRTSLAESKKSRWCEKTPGHERYYKTILRFYPDARIIFLVRDPRAVARSLVDVPWGPRTTFVQSKIWNESAKLARKLICLKNVHPLTYEDLIFSPQTELKKVCDFIDEEFSMKMIENRQQNFDRNDDEGWTSSYEKKVVAPVDSRNIRKWRAELDSSDIRKIEVRCSSLMTYFGYDRITSESLLARSFVRLDVLGEFYCRTIAKKIEGS